MSKQGVKSTVPVEKNPKIGKCVSTIKPQVKSTLSNESKKVNNVKGPPKNTSKVLSVVENKSKEGTEAKCSLQEMVDLSKPNLCSTLQIASEIQAASIASRPTQTLSQLKNLQALNKTKISKKTNIPFSKQIFQNLVDLEVSDNDFKSGKKLSKPTNFGQKKDEVFDLSSFYKPDFSTEFCAKPKLIPQEMEYIQHYNGCEIYDRIQSLTCK